MIWIETLQFMLRMIAVVILSTKLDSSFENKLQEVFIQSQIVLDVYYCLLGFAFSYLYWDIRCDIKN